MTVNILEAKKITLREVLAARKIPDLEAGSEDVRLDLGLSLYQLEEE